MIWTFHGAFDHTDEPDSGISLITAAAKEMQLSQDIAEFEAEDDAEPSKSLVTREPIALVGYSNGAHKVVDIASRLCLEYGSYIQLHMLLIDGVRRGGGLFGARFHVPKEVLSCWHWIRTIDVTVPPYHQMIDKDEPPLFRTFKVESDHGGIILSRDVQLGVPTRLAEIFTPRGVV